jgi:hypothetical protein
MTVKFCFGNARKDGTKNLKIRLKSKGRDKKIGVPGVYIDPKYWDTPNNRVKSTYTNAEAYNEIVSNYLEKIVKVKGQLELKQIDFETAFRMLSSSSSVNSIVEFVNSHCQDSSVQWKRNTLGTLNACMNHLELHDITFEDITYENLVKLKKSILSKGLSADTYNNYFRHIRAVYNLAIKKRATYREFHFDKGLLIKVNQHNKKLLTHVPKDIAMAIDRIEIKSNHKSAKGSALRDLEAIGFWLLKFALRGCYGKDITTLSSYDSDYNYDYKTQYLNLRAMQKPKEMKGSAHFIDHKRHKTKNVMRIWITLPPIGGLIFILKRLVANTHPKIAYLSREDLLLTPEQLWEKKHNDIHRIFKHSSDDYKTDENLWNNMNKHLKKLGLYSFESARKSFNTTATYLQIHPSITKTLVGHTDRTIQSHYNNYNDARLVKSVQEAHLQVLHSFKMIELFDKWVLKINELFGKFHDFHVGGGSTVVYKHQHLFLQDIMKNQSTIVDNMPAFKEIYSLSEPK